MESKDILEKSSKYNYRTRYKNLWFPPKGWLTSYRCQCCNEIMTKKNPTKTPQCITTCGHIMCAKCIVNSYFIELSILCPVKDCGKYVDPKDEPLDTTENSVASIETFDTNNEYDTYLEDESKWHYCADWLCPGNCGTLVCGCIDICKGNCK